MMQTAYIEKWKFNSYGRDHSVSLLQISWIGPKLNSIIDPALNLVLVLTQEKSQSVILMTKMLIERNCPRKLFIKSIEGNSVKCPAVCFMNLTDRVEISASSVSLRLITAELKYRHNSFNSLMRNSESETVINPSFPELRIG
jgi:hypothetical protein